MELNFKNILLESIIDELETLSRMDKAVLKFIHQSMDKKTFNHTVGKTSYEMDASDALRINDLINTFGLKDYDYVFKMWNFYKKFGGVLFDDEVFDDFSYSKEDYDEATKVIVAKYYLDNILIINFSHSVLLILVHYLHIKNHYNYILTMICFL